MLNPGAHQYGDIPLWSEDLPQIRRLLVDDAEPLAAFYNAMRANAKRLFHPYGDSMTAMVARRIYVESFRGEREDVVAVRKSRVVGWAFLRHRARCDPWELSLGIAVSPSMQAKGLGGRLLTKLEERGRKRSLRSMRLIVLQTNAPAITLYKQHGFETIEEFTVKREPYFAMRKSLCE